MPWPQLLTAVTALAATMIVSGDAIAQTSGAIRVSGGASQLYLDEPWQGVGAVSYLLPLGQRLGVETELAMSVGRRFRHWSVIPNLSYTFN